MHFGILGPLAVRNDRDEPVPIPGRKVRALLADLLVHEGRAVSADRLVDDLWGESAPADPAAALHVRVSQRRRALAAANPGHVLRGAAETLDALRVRRPPRRGPDGRGGRA
ncbi:winged helix-turn-helix domain-containing protein [Glycomyces arizonensis]|uniref:AfsR/SARP family transcriptional regulator n=1 Tax=Glycomyces arizonensis TaxID=256035 RepID=UPI0003FC7533|nr:winged helix-turn-helix domain-containing protein [Glycomyces arizonensis]